MANRVQASRTRGRVIVEGPLRVGSDVLLSGNSMRGDVQLVKRIALSAGTDSNGSFRLPAARITGFKLLNETAVVTAGSVWVNTPLGGLLASAAVAASGAVDLTIKDAASLVATSGATFTVFGTSDANKIAGSFYVFYTQTGTAD